MQIVCERVKGDELQVFVDILALAVCLDVFTSFFGIAVSVKVIMHFYSCSGVGYSFLI